MKELKRNIRFFNDILEGYGIKQLIIGLAIIGGLYSWVCLLGMMV